MGCEKRQYVFVINFKSSVTNRKMVLFFLLSNEALHRSEFNKRSLFVPLGIKQEQLHNTEPIHKRGQIGNTRVGYPQNKMFHSSRTLVFWFGF